mmetsp:Transcript_65078/g.95295  ORF Transcript_65078/g.95295 Transcript_65078/m.95295 type:complete len:212 (+) Transcript_65078:132-767(+)|eukprot:CAMPEP_0173113090 /NCGR_PEP_ID=MMETSP1102-20130122/46563_1 /TAXON_ID=49646 /ORGANISM="Geminigera sp., Strain Caron Lab Isolate" /LENGTH=211 /DNA_ID=CAMNT_0014014599 /DNA_START=225 /DNA_END=860 /DNA_ORIENTATION=-
MLWKVLLLSAVAISAAYAPVLTIPLRARQSRSSVKMLFQKTGPGKGGGKLEPAAGKTVVTFMPGGAQVYARPGERLGDIAKRAGFDVPYGCREGVCGTCEAKMKQPSGQTNDVRICKDSVPKTNMDCPDREKMWGDLRGGKKSIGELQGPPMEITIILQNPSMALKRQRTWEDVKESVKVNEAKWLDPNYKGSTTVRRDGAGQAKKKGWFS